MDKPGQVLCHAILDFICPLCYEGAKTLKTALEEHSLPVPVDVHAYFLSPEDLEDRSGHAHYERIKAHAQQKGTLNAHRLIAFTQQHAPGKQLELAVAIMKAFHEDHQDIENAETLTNIAASISLPVATVKSFLEATSLATEDVRQEAEMNAGPQGVPYFVFEVGARQKIIFSGPQTPDIFLEAIKNLSNS